MSISLDTLKEYVVTLHKFDDLESFYTDMETEGGLEYIPNRRVDCHIRRPVSRNTHYMLTDEEATALCLDPRVLAVELTMEELGIICEPAGSYTQTSNQWSKSLTLAQGDLNWGLYRVFNGSQVPNWAADGTENVSGTVSMPLSGANVDVVIVDGMLDPAHPEFAVNSNGTGGSRVIQYNWYSLNPTVTGGGTASYSYLLDPTDLDYKHGHHVAGITAGNTHGWARGANIYNISPVYVTGGVSSTYLYDYIKVWHQNKPVNPLTGVKNPTITNNSWQSIYTVAYTNITSVLYRGTTTTKSFTKSELNAYGIYVDNSDNAIIPARTAAIDADIADLIAAGVIFVACAGNYYTKMDVPGGVDYDNKVFWSETSNSYFSYTNRGSTPGSAPGAICVGATGAGIMNGGDAKASFSNTGPRIDIWAPGTLIASSWVGSTGTVAFANPVPDVRNSLYYVAKVSGTSMSCPQVAGVLACLLERFPLTAQTTARAIITSTLRATGQIPATTGTGGPTDYWDLQGAPNSHLKWVDIPLPTFKGLDVPQPWETTGTIGTLVTGEISELYVKGNFPTSTVSTTYKISSGTLPSGLILNRDGTISGRANRIDTILNTATSTSSFVIAITDSNNNQVRSGTFSITVKQTDSTEYTEIYCKPFLVQSKRSEFTEFIRNEKIFIPNMLYRPLDSNFGKQEEIRLVIDFGVKKETLATYANAISTNFYKRNIALGELKTAVARNADGTIKHEIIYVDIIDKHTNSSRISAPKEITFNGTTYYPPSILNMRYRINENLTVTNIRNPSFTNTVQLGNSTVSGYIPFVPICCTLPGKGVTIIRKINESNFKFNTFNFEIDRIIIQNSLNQTDAKYMALNRNSKLV